jgi:hypothetical protein
MSHVVLARKYRPRSFAQMVGPAHVVQALGNALTSGRLHHAYLFTGTRGIGKTTVSRILAKSLNCTGPDGAGGVTAEPCGVCQACTEIDADRYIDYIELDAASNRSIDEIRENFRRAHEARFGFWDQDRELIVESVSAEAAANATPPCTPTIAPHRNGAPLPVTARANLFAHGKSHGAPIILRDHLDPGDGARGRCWQQDRVIYELTRNLAAFY